MEVGTFLHDFIYAYLRNENQRTPRVVASTTVKLVTTGAVAAFTFARIGRPGHGHASAEMFSTLAQTHQSLRCVMAWGDDVPPVVRPRGVPLHDRGDDVDAARPLPVGAAGRRASRRGERPLARRSSLRGERP